jgi:hypothetical protein
MALRRLLLLLTDFEDMSKFDKVMFTHIKYIIFCEKRPFSYSDFKSFRVQGNEYCMKHGTFRNKISRLVREGIAEVAYKSNVAFYTLRGTNIGKKKNMMTPPMTPNHMGVNGVIKSNGVIMDNNSTSPLILDIIQDIPAEKNALHDIRFRFEASDIWKVLYHSGRYTPNPVSKDIPVNVLNAYGLKITTTVHRTDTVTVIAACSDNPVVVDTCGLIRLSTALTRVEERLSRIVDECGSLLLDGYESIPIPTNDRWQVTMWHFGYDSSLEYTGPRFCATWQDGQNALARAYSKSTRSGIIFRNELQQYPQKKWGDISQRAEQ